MTISISAVHSLSFCSLKRRTSSVHSQSFENWIYSIVPETAQITCFMMTLMSVAYSASFNPVLHKSYDAPNESLQISFCQNVLGKDQTRCFIMIPRSIVHSLSFSSPRRITNSVHYESFENWIYLKIAAKCSNHLFHDDFDVSGIFRKPEPCTTQTELRFVSSRFVRSCIELTKPIVLS